MVNAPASILTWKNNSYFYGSHAREEHWLEKITAISMVARRYHYDLRNTAVISMVSALAENVNKNSSLRLLVLSFNPTKFYNLINRY